MHNIVLKTAEIDKKELYKRNAMESDAEMEITEDTIAFDENGKPIFALITLSQFPISIPEIEKIKWLDSKRVSGMNAVRKIFGYQARIPMRDDVTKLAVMAKQNPVLHQKIVDQGIIFGQYFKQYFPDVFQAQMDTITNEILPEWRLKDQPFTSGIVNRSNPLPYHLDSGNLKGSMSAMVVMQQGVLGGNLVIPEYNAKIHFGDKERLLIFNGAELLHGVTPIRKKNSNAVRYSLVYYPLEKLKDALPYDQELKRWREVQRKRVLKRVDIINSKNAPTES